MKSVNVIVLVAGLLLSSAGYTESTSGASTPSGEYSRNNFVLCPALEAHRAELGSMVGIPQNDQPIQDVANRLSCQMRGTESGAWLQVEVLPAFLKPSQLQPEAFDAPATRVPELGEHGWYISDAHLRRVVFTMGTLIIQVQAECNSRPDQSAMVAVSKKIGELLAQANQ